MTSLLRCNHLKPAAHCLAAVLVFAGAGAFGASPHPETSAKTECASISSAILGRSVEYCVAFPPGYDAASNKRYPTLYFLHGLFEDERSWLDRGGEQIWETLTEQGAIGNFIVVLPAGGRTFYVNSQDGHDRYEDFFIQEMVPEIDRKYRTRAVASERGLSGVSMGGYGALHLAMRHPDVFGSASAHSAALLPKFPDPLPTEGRWGFYARVLQGPFGSPLNESYFDANNPLTLAEHPERFSHLALYFDCGDHDRYGFNEGAELLDRALSQKNFPHTFALRAGGHGWDYLHEYMHFSLEFESKVFTQAEKASLTPH
ncbi:MAG: alpha/beta hydrolase family protein [Terriglobia bacterium]|jgi:putative tributyrin esterase